MKKISLIAIGRIQVFKKKIMFFRSVMYNYCDTFYRCSLGLHQFYSRALKYRFALLKAIMTTGAVKTEDVNPPPPLVCLPMPIVHLLTNPIDHHCGIKRTRWNHSLQSSSVEVFLGIASSIWNSWIVLLYIPRGLKIILSSLFLWVSIVELCVEVCLLFSTHRYML